MLITTFDQRWETKIYSQGRHVNRWPFDVVVSFIFRYYPRDIPRQNLRILEVGCGAGNNLWFAAREGFQVFGVDASPTAVQYAKQRLREEKLPADIRLADFTNLPFEDEYFDMVIDRYAISCVEQEAGRLAVQEVHRTLRPGGLFLFDCGSTEDGAYQHRDRLEADQEISEGRYTDLKLLTFYDRAALTALFAMGWEMVSLEHQVITDHMQPDYLTRADWRVVVQRKQTVSQEIRDGRAESLCEAGMTVAAASMMALTPASGQTSDCGVLSPVPGSLVVPVPGAVAPIVHRPGFVAEYLHRFGMSIC